MEAHCNRSIKRSCRRRPTPRHKLLHTYLKRPVVVPRAPPGTHIADSHAVQHMLSTAGASVRYGDVRRKRAAVAAETEEATAGAGQERATRAQLNRCTLSPAHARIGMLVTCRQPWRRKLRKQLRAPARSNTTSPTCCIVSRRPRQKSFSAAHAQHLWELHFHP